MSAARSGEVFERFLDTKASLAELSLQKVEIPRTNFFRSSIGLRNKRQALLVTWTGLDGEWGVGECSCRSDPYFNGEYVDGAISVLRDFVFPQLTARCTLRQIVAVTTRMRGWHFTVAALLDSVIDMIRRRDGGDVYDLFSDSPSSHVPVGLSLPLFDEPDDAVDRVHQAVENGYRRVKMKVSPTMNLETVGAVREAFPTTSLSFDANGAFSENEMHLLEELGRYRPTVVEQPFDPVRLDLNIALKKRLPDLRLCLDEGIRGLGDVIVADRVGALDEVNLKPGRVGGPLESIRILKFCGAKGIPVWVGGMFETGVGRSALLRVAARIPEARAHDLSPPSTYLSADLVTTDLEMDLSGQISVGDCAPVELDASTIDAFSTEGFVLTKPPS